ncbi:MAG TPA: hypothetical protein VKA82_03180 [Rubrobacter sp.]|nr:hypothetical protein [Rubrobacter sp.]
MTHAKVEPFGESQSWALLSNSLHSSPPADLPEGLVGFTEYRDINDVACPMLPLLHDPGATTRRPQGSLW